MKIGYFEHWFRPPYTFAEFAKAYISEFSINSKLEDIYEIVYGDKNEESKKG